MILDAIFTLCWAAFLYETARRDRDIAQVGGFGIPAALAVPVLTALGMSAFLIDTSPRAIVIDVMIIGVAVAVWTDVRCGYIFDVTTLSTAVLTFVLLWITTQDPWRIVDAAISGAVIAGLFAVFSISKDAIGWGDVKLAISIGAAIGLNALWLFIAVVACSLLVSYAIFRIYGERKGSFALGPVLGLSAAFTVVVAGSIGWVPTL